MLANLIYQYRRWRYRKALGGMFADESIPKSAYLSGAAHLAEIYKLTKAEGEIEFRNYRNERLDRMMKATR